MNKDHSTFKEDKLYTCGEMRKNLWEQNLENIKKNLIPVSKSWNALSQLSSTLKEIFWSY